MTNPNLSIEVTACSKTRREMGRLYRLPSDTGIKKRIPFSVGLEMVRNERLVPSITNVLSVVEGDFSGWKLYMMRKHVSDELLSGRNDLNAVLSEGVKAADRYRDHAAERGTAVHAAIEEFFKNGCSYEELPYGEVGEYFSGFMKFFRDFSYSMRPIMQEVTVYGETPQGKLYAGTIDCLAEIDGELALIDWKATKSLSGKVSLQLAAAQNAQYYAHPETGELVEMPKVKNLFACQLKPYGYSFQKVQDPALAWERFCEARYAWDVKVLQGGSAQEMLEEYHSSQPLTAAPKSHRVCSNNGFHVEPHAVDNAHVRADFIVPFSEGELAPPTF